MLEFIRDRAQGWIAMVIVAMLILVFAVWGLDAYFSPDPVVPAAYVNEQKISVNDFQRRYQQERNRIQSMIGGMDINQVIPDENEFKSGILRRLVDEELLKQAANEEGYRVSDALLAQQIRSFEAFQSDGQFDPALYESWLGQQFMSPGQFEEMLRNEVMTQQYRMGIVATAWVSESEKARVLSLKEQQRDIGYTMVSASDFLEKIEISDEQAQQYYDENASQYMTPEQVSISYIDLSVEELAKKVELSEGTLEELYEERKDGFGVPEERRTRHIMIEIDPEGGENADAEAREKIESLLAKVSNGESFEELAKEHSDDFGSAREGGDLGFLQRSSMMDEMYADAAFALKKDEVSDVVKSSYGYHLIQLLDIKEGETKSFADVKQQLEDEYRRAEAEESFYDLSERLANMAFEQPDTLSNVEAELGLTLKTSPLFSRNFGPGVAMEAKVREAAFADEVLVEGNNSDLLELKDGQVVVLRVKEHKEAQQRAFDEVKAAIVNKLKREQAQEKAKEKGEALLAKITEIGDAASLSKNEGLEWNRPGFAKRDSTALTIEVVKKAFSMKRPQEEQPQFEGLAMPSGDYAVIGLYAVKDGEVEAVAEAEQKTLEDQRARYYGIAEMLGTVNSLRDQAKIKEFPDNI